MSSERGTQLRWLACFVLLPVAALAALSISLAASGLEARSLEPFYDSQAGGFILRHSWLMDGVLHIGGRYMVAAAVATLLVLAVLGLRRPRSRPWSLRLVYLATCVIVTSALTGLWKELAGQTSPWHWQPFGGTLPWPEPGGARSLAQSLGSPGMHAATGFAWMALFFVGAASGARWRIWWVVPGAVLGSLFALAQHVRGAHEPSHQVWSLAVAWMVAAALALLFRWRGWMDWSETPPAAEALGKHLPAVAAVETPPWIFALSGLFLGTAFFTIDMVTDEIEEGLPGVHAGVEVLEILLMGPGVAAASYLLTEKLREVRQSARRRAETERERRFQLLGRMSASVAHEVRNPLHSMRLIVDEQRLEIPALESHALSAELDTCIERIDQAVDLVYRLARPEGGDQREVDLVGIVREAIERSERAAPNAAIFRLGRLPERAAVLSPPAGLAIVVENVLRNAQQAAVRGSSVVVTLERERETWVLTVVNHDSLSGKGAQQETTKPQGLGLGLAISRQIAAGCGGRITLSEQDGSVRCEVRWPALQAENP